MSLEKVERVILGVVESNSEIWYVELVDLPSNDYSVGNIYRKPSISSNGNVPELSLSTNDELSTIWASSNGSIWIASCNGIVATTAKVEWNDTTGKNYFSNEERTKWTAIALPKIISTGLPPNISALWGLNDDYVFAGTYSGHIYFWNGNNWIQSYEGLENGSGTIKSFAGIKENNIIAIGQNDCILNFDGLSWKTLSIDGENNGRENFTGIHAYENGDFIISGNGNKGRVLKGKSNGLVELCHTSIQLIDLVMVQERILFATGDGVAELFDNEVQMIKSNFMTSSAWKGNNKAFFIEPEQPLPCYIEYNPNTSEHSWRRIKY